MTTCANKEKFDLDVFLESKEGNDLNDKDLRYIFEHFVTEVTSAERQETLLAALQENTTALKEIRNEYADHESRICVIEENKVQSRWLIPVLISCCVLIVGIAGTAIAVIKLTR